MDLGIKSEAADSPGLKGKLHIAVLPLNMLLQPTQEFAYCQKQLLYLKINSAVVSNAMDLVKIRKHLTF